MNLQAYIKGCNRGEFQWACIESGTYGEGNSVDVEEVILEGRVGKITRLNASEYETYVDGLKHEPFYDENTLSSRLNARKWCEKMLRNDVELDKDEI